MKIKVGILRGGTDYHHKNSLQKGTDIMLCILENFSDKYKVVDIFIDKEGIWHANGIPITPVNLINKINIVLNTLKDPKIINILKNFSIPIIGPQNLFELLENNKEMFKAHLKNIGVKTPRFVVFPKSAREVFEKFSAPWIVKIDNKIKPVKTFDELAEIIKNKDDLIIEEFISGKIVFTHSVSGFRGEEVYVLPPTNLSSAEKDYLINLVKDLHFHLGVKNYLKCDFILHPKKGFFLREINSLPDLQEDSHFHKCCEFIGVKKHHLLDHILEKALNK